MRRLGYTLCIGTLLAYSCSDNTSNRSRGTQQVEAMQINTTSPNIDNKQKPQIIEEKDSVFNHTGTTIDSYEEGLLDGESMAEEDRLAGRPGMQTGMEDNDDDDDYEDGFDDGYEE